MMTRSRLAPSIALLAVAAMTAGCANSDRVQSEAVAQSQSISSLPEESLDTHFGDLPLIYEGLPTTEKNQDTWALPLDRYYDEHVMELNLLASDLVKTVCMHEAGFTEYHLRTDYSAPKSPTQGNTAITQLFTVELAKQYGYRMAPDPSDTLAGRIRANGGYAYADESDEFLNALERCERDVADQVMHPNRQEEEEQRKAEDRALWEQLHPGEPYPTTDEEFDVWMLERDAFEEPERQAAADSPLNLNRWQVDTSAPELQAAAEQWRECMAPLGIVDLPMEPWKVGTRPPESLAELFEWPDKTGPASAREIEIATHDAQCRQDSGRFDLLYEESWNQEQAFLDQYRDQLDAKYSGFDEQTADYALQVIREYLPKLGGTY